MARQGSDSKAGLGQTDSIKFIADYFRKAGIAYISDPSEREAAINGWILVYKEDGYPAQQKIVALDSIICNTLYLSATVLKKPGFDAAQFEDGLQNITVSVLEALENYDHLRGTKFTAFLAGYFKSAIDQTIREESIVRIPKQVRRRTAAKKLREATQYVDDAPSSPGDGDKPQHIDSEEAHSEECEQGDPELLYAAYDRALEPAKSEVGIEAIRPIGQPEALTTEQLLHVKQVLEILAHALHDDEAGLSEKEKLVITLRHGLFGAPKLTLGGVADTFQSRGWNATKEWIFQLQKRALHKLRTYFAEMGVEMPALN